MKCIRKICIAILGIKGYIRLAGKAYIWLVLHGYLKKQYPELFFLKKIIKHGFTCLDIGANLGYYSTMLSKLAGEKGSVFSVEPIPMFCEIWKKNVKNSGINNLQLYPFALGGENKTVRMGMPERDGLIHHGMTKIVSLADENYKQYFDVEMKIPDELFKNIERLDFIKCDVEGYESEVFSNMTVVISKFKPLIQSELSGKGNREKVITILKKIGYSIRILNDREELVPVDENSLYTLDKDFYFVFDK